MGLPAPVNCRSRMPCNNGNGPDMWAPMPNNGNGPVICRAFFVAFLFFSFGLLTARISMFYLVMMKEASIIKDNTIRETVDGLLCHPWLEERASKDLVWTLEASGKGCLLADAIANQAKSKSYV